MPGWALEASARGMSFKELIMKWFEDSDSLFVNEALSMRELRRAMEALRAEGAHALGDGRVCAVIHEKGRPRWGPVRTSKSLAERDRKEMKSAIRAGTLDALLLAYRRDASPSAVAS